MPEPVEPSQFLLHELLQVPSKPLWYGRAELESHTIDQMFATAGKLAFELIAPLNAKRNHTVAANNVLARRRRHQASRTRTSSFTKNSWHGNERVNASRLTGAIAPGHLSRELRVLQPNGKLVGHAINTPTASPSYDKDADELQSSRSSRKEHERLSYEIGMKLEHRAVSGIGINDEFAVWKALRQIVRVPAWNHAIAVAIRDEDGVVNLR